MTRRFERDYDIRIYPVDEPNNVIRIRPPLRIVFTASKTTSVESANKLAVEIYNLNESNRLLLLRREGLGGTFAKRSFAISMSIGYDGRLEHLYTGRIHTVFSNKTGSDYVTRIESYSALALANADTYISATVTDTTKALEVIVDNTRDLKIGKIVAQVGTTRPMVMVGSAKAVLDDVITSGVHAFIENDQLVVIGENQVIGRHVPLITSETGLLRPPNVEGGITTFETMFNPAIRVGGAVRLHSDVSAYLNGVHKVTVVTYSGDYEGDSWTQSVRAILLQNYEVI